MALDPRSPFSSLHPLAGKIAAGVRTTENRARLPQSHVSMQLAEMPIATMADRAQQMFSLTDMKGTRVYYSELGVFNTCDEQGKSINFIQGLYKTDDRTVCRFLQYFVDKGDIQYLELKEDPSDAITSQSKPPERGERQPGSNGGNEQSNESDQPQPVRRIEATPDTNRSVPGGEPEQDQQPGNGATVSSQPGNGDDSPVPSGGNVTVGQAEPTVTAKPSSLRDMLKAKSG